jgi:cell division septum initiation protein DivIVA
MTPNLYYINEEVNALHDLVTELYESMFDTKEDARMAIDNLRIKIEELEDDL